MRVERRRRIAEEKGRARLKSVSPSSLSERSDRWRGLPCDARLAIDDVLFFLDGEAAIIGQAVAQSQEDQRALLAVLFCQRQYLRFARYGLADAQQRVKGESPARPHPARQRNRRQEAAEFRMAVGAELRLARAWGEIDPVPQGRQRVPVPRRARVIQRERKTLRLGFGKRVGRAHLAAHPLLEMIHINDGHAPLSSNSAERT